MMSLNSESIAVKIDTNCFNRLSVYTCVALKIFHNRQPTAFVGVNLIVNIEC